MKTTVLICAALLTGCATTVFEHDTKTAAEFDKDLYDCQTVAKQRTADSGYAGNVFIENDETKECLIRKHGWYPAQ
jgi:uncharacterized protein YceK